MGQLLCGDFHQVRVVKSVSILEGIQQKSSSDRHKGEIIAPAYRTRDFDLFTTRMKALSMAKRN